MAPVKWWSTRSQGDRDGPRNATIATLLPLTPTKAPDNPTVTRAIVEKLKQQAILQKIAWETVSKYSYAR